jgi:hypothetical protein
MLFLFSIMGAFLVLRDGAPVIAAGLAYQYVTEGHLRFWEGKEAVGGAQEIVESDSEVSTG